MPLLPGLLSGRPCSFLAWRREEYGRSAWCWWARSSRGGVWPLLRWLKASCMGWEVSWRHRSPAWHWMRGAGMAFPWRSPVPARCSGCFRSGFFAAGAGSRCAVNRRQRNRGALLIVMLGAAEGRARASMDQTARCGKMDTRASAMADLGHDARKKTARCGKIAQGSVHEFSAVMPGAGHLAGARASMDQTARCGKMDTRASAMADLGYD